jgi:putative transposase
MSTFTQICYHIVFSTKKREAAITAQRREDLYRYIWGIIQNHQCHLYRIGGTADHLHILTTLHPAVPLADLVKDIKVASSRWIRDEGAFHRFSHWQDGYAAFTVAHQEKARLIEYIKGQAEHHRRVSFHDEMRKLLVENGVEFDERYLI